jgi:putative methyltransferase (TIGR04325 family)
VVTHHFCTYFDHNYLPRALVLIESLRAQRASFHLHVVCLSDLCQRMLTELALPEITVIPLAAVEQHYPELPRIKPTRKPIEYMFTTTPFLPAYCLATNPGLAEITYLDADLYFYADPQAVFDHIGARSIGIFPHRFSPDLQDYVMFGKYNVGWLTFRATAEGLRCLGDYRRDCIDWCYDRVEGDRYADQRYLDRWPETYGDVAVIDMKGANAANFNVDNYQVTERDGGLWCDDDPLVFYHFHGVFLQEDGSYWIHYPKRHGAEEGVVVRRIYRPYLARLLEATERLRTRFPEFRSARQVLRPYIDKIPIKVGGWDDDLLSRRRCAHALELRDRLRTAPRFDASAGHFLQFAETLLRLCERQPRLSMLDWGGGFGEHGWWLRLALPTLDLEYHVRETGPVCDYGATVFPETRFHDDDGAFDRSYDVVLASAALHYAEDWPATLERLARCTAHSLILVDVPVAAGTSGYVVPEHPLPTIPQVEFFGPILDDVRLRAIVEAAGLSFAEELPATSIDPLPVGSATLRYRSMRFTRSGS